jgi:hypothetical protein
LPRSGPNAKLPLPGDVDAQIRGKSLRQKSSVMSSGGRTWQR